MKEIIGNKNFLRLLALCDLITFLNVAKLLWNYIITIFSSFWFINIITITLILSLLATAYFNFYNPRLGIKIYYFQFPLRFAFVIMTFGFLTFLNGLTSNDISQTLIFIAMGLELLRLVFNILTHRYINSQEVRG